MSEGIVLAAMAVVVSGFLASSLYDQTVVAHVHDAATQIARDKAPSVEHLAAARADMHQLEMMVSDFVRGEEGPGELAQIEASEHQLQADLARYVALPTDDDEQGFVDALEQEMGNLREATGAAVAKAQAGDDVSAREVIRERIRPTIDRARELILQDTELNARQARQLAASIDAVRARSERVTYGLDIVMAIIAIAAAFVAVRIVRRYTRLVEEAAARDRERSTELELFAARVAHDVLSPLTPAAVSLDMLGRQFQHDDRARALTARGQAALRRVVALVEELLTFARAGAQASGEGHADVARTCHEVVEEVAATAAAAHVTVRIERMPPLSVRCPEMLLADVLRNLLRNAIQHMGDSAHREVTIRVAPAGHAVRFEVQDTGPGIPEELQGRIFEPYVRGPGRSSPGLGLGLATVKRIVEGHHGELGVRRSPEGGSLFWFTLPRELAAEASPQTH